MTNSVMNDVTLKIGSDSLADFLDKLGVHSGPRDRVIAIDRELSAELERDPVDHERCVRLFNEVAVILGRLWRLPPSFAGIEGGFNFDFDEMDWGSDDIEDGEVADV